MTVYCSGDECTNTLSLEQCVEGDIFQVPESLRDEDLPDGWKITYQPSANDEPPGVLCPSCQLWVTNESGATEFDERRLKER